jgi:GGDEF domain-containing protein
VIGAPSVPFRPLAIAAVNAALDQVQRWLDSSDGRAHVADHEVFTAGFERRIDEEIARARRFGLELVVLLIGSASGIPKQAEGTLADAIRGGLRGSDLVGKLGLGEIAVILVHTGVHGARSVEERLKGRLQAVLRDGNLPSITIGEGGFPSAGDTTEALLSRARAQHTVLLNEIGTGDGH